MKPDQQLCIRCRIRIAMPEMKHKTCWWCYQSLGGKYPAEKSNKPRDTNSEEKST